MKNDIFGDNTPRARYFRGNSASKTLIKVLSIISAIAVLVIIFNFKLVTALIAMGVAGILTTCIPIILIFGFIFYIIIRINCRRRRYWW